MCFSVRITNADYNVHMAVEYSITELDPVISDSDPLGSYLETNGNIMLSH